MTYPISAVAFFCEDIREEKTGVVSLMGIMPDNVIMPQPLPMGFPKLGVYVRINVDPNVDPGILSIILRAPDGSEITTVNTLEKELIDNARREAIEAGSPVAGLIAYTVAAPLIVAREGRILAVLRASETEHVIGGLHVQGSEAKATSTASPPLS